MLTANAGSYRTTLIPSRAPHSRGSHLSSPDPTIPSDLAPSGRLFGGQARA